MARISIGEFSFEPETFQRFDSLLRKSLMHQWFFENFEDPWNNLSYDREDGWVWGENGPHEAHEELEQVFGELVSETDLIEAALEIEKKGVTWARKDEPLTARLIRTWRMEDVNAQPPYRLKDAHWLALKEHVIPFSDGFAENDHSSSQPPIYGDYAFADNSFVGDSFAGRTRRRSEGPDTRSVEQNARAALQAELAEARRQLGSLKETHPRNHNNPPEEIEVDREAAAQVTNITITIDRLEIYVGQQKPDIVKVAKEVSRLRSVLEWCGARAAAYVDGLGPAITVVYANSPEKIGLIATSLYRAAAHWIDALLRMIS